MYNMFLYIAHIILLNVHFNIGVINKMYSTEYDEFLIIYIWSYLIFLRILINFNNIH